LFTHDTERIAHECHFIRRQRTLSSTDFVHTLVFRWIDDPQATFDSFAPELGVTAKTLRQRCTSPAHDLFKQLITYALSQSISDTSDRPRLMKRFSAVIVEECTTIPLPPDAAKNFSARGGTNPDDNAAGIKLFLRWNILNVEATASASIPPRPLLYQSRWQVELLFRRCKQHLGWSETHGRTEGRVMLEVLAKVLGAVVVLRGALLRGGPLGVIGHDRSYPAVIRCAVTILIALCGCCSLVMVLMNLATQLRKLRGQVVGEGKPLGNRWQDIELRLNLRPVGLHP